MKTIDFARGLELPMALVTERAAFVGRPGRGKSYAASYQADGGGFNNALSRLRTLELVEGRGELKVSGALFDSTERKRKP